MVVCTRCGHRITKLEPRVVTGVSVWCAPCTYAVEHRGEPRDSEWARQERARMEAARRGRKVPA